MVVGMQDGFHAGCGVDINERPAEHRRPLARITLEKRDIALIDAGATLLLETPNDPVVVVVYHQLQPLARQRAIRPQTEREHAQPWVSCGLPARTHISDTAGELPFVGKRQRHTTLKRATVGQFSLSAR